MLWFKIYFDNFELHKGQLIEILNESLDMRLPHEAHLKESSTLTKLPVTKHIV